MIVNYLPSLFEIGSDIFDNRRLTSNLLWYEWFD